MNRGIKGGATMAWFGVAVFLGSACVSERQTMPDAKNPLRLRRADSFLGIHFDFHAREDCTAVE